MTWVSLRQFRGQAITGAAVIVVVAVVLAITGARLDHLYTLYRNCSDNVSCGTLREQVLTSYPRVKVIGSLLIAVPALVGIFWGAPLVAAELENRTHLLAWTQSVTRTRWIVTKLVLVGLASAVAAGLYSLAVTWWSIPFDRVGADRIVPGTFDQRGVVPIAYALFAFALGVTAGVLIRRTLPAMAVTLAGFVGIRMLIQYVVRPNLISPMHRNLALGTNLAVGIKRSPTGVSLVTGRPDLHGAWVTGSTVVNAAGQSPTTEVIRHACAAALAPAPPPAGKSQVPPPGALRAFHQCLHNLGLNYHLALTYQPDSRFWSLQLLESGIFLVVAGLLAVITVSWVRRRVE
jgi:hypothetical protein